MTATQQAPYAADSIAGSNQTSKVPGRVKKREESYCEGYDRRTAAALAGAGAGWSIAKAPAAEPSKPSQLGRHPQRALEGRRDYFLPNSVAAGSAHKSEGSNPAYLPQKNRRDAVDRLKLHMSATAALCPTRCASCHIPKQWHLGCGDCLPPCTACSEECNMQCTPAFPSWQSSLIMEREVHQAGLVLKL